MIGFRKHHDNYREFRRQLRSMRYDLDFSHLLGLQAETIPLNDPQWRPKRDAQRALREFRLRAADLFLEFLPPMGECNRRGLWPALQAFVHPFGEKVAQLLWDINPQELLPAYRWPTDEQIRKVFDLTCFVRRK